MWFAKSKEFTRARCAAPRLYLLVAQGPGEHAGVVAVTEHQRHQISLVNSKKKSDTSKSGDAFRVGMFLGSAAHLHVLRARMGVHRTCS